MILTELNFGSAPDLEKGKVEEIAENYIASLFHAGQLCGEYFLTWIGRKLICHGILTGVGANKTRFHSPWGRANLKKVVAAFGRSPIWTIRDDDCPKRNISWNALSLYLFTHAFDWAPPLCRGDDGQPVPTFLLPLGFDLKESLYRWQVEYVLHDRLWLNSGTLEIPAYKEITDPNSALSKAGRELCAEIEKATGKLTYYFLGRFYSSGQHADDRPCPGCGDVWKVTKTLGNEFHHWSFRCEKCRLVSTAGVEVNRRLAKIGQWRSR